MIVLLAFGGKSRSDHLLSALENAIVKDTKSLDDSCKLALKSMMKSRISFISPRQASFTA